MATPAEKAQAALQQQNGAVVGGDPTPSSEAAQEGAEAPTEATSQEGSTNENGERAGEQNAATDSDSIDTLPEWAKKEISTLRKESASRRVENNTLKEQLEAASKADDPEETRRLISELQGNLEAERLAASRYKYARQFGLPETVDVLLDGVSEDQIKAKAEALSSLWGTGPNAVPPVPKPSAPEPTGGREPYAAGAPDVSTLIAQARAQR